MKTAKNTALSVQEKRQITLEKKSKLMSPTINNYNQRLGKLLKENKLDKFTETYIEMRRQKIPATMQTYNLKLKALSKVLSFAITLSITHQRQATRKNCWNN
jgi:hypothetical protein